MQTKTRSLLTAVAALLHAAGAMPQATDGDSSITFIEVKKGDKCSRLGKHLHSVQNNHDYKTIRVIVQWDADELQLVKTFYVGPRASEQVDCSYGATVKESTFTDF